MKVLAEISIGELVDKVTILEIKRQRLTNPNALRNVAKEYAALSARLAPLLAKRSELAALKSDLRHLNETLWDIEDAIREKESRKEFGSEFIQLARSVYFENDKRSKIKRQINELLDSEIMEEKSYSEY